MGMTTELRVAQCIGQQGQADTGIACSAFDDTPTGLQFARCLCGANDAQCGAIFYRASRVEEFGFAENGAAGLLRDLLQVQQRGVANQLGDVRGGVHVCSPQNSRRVCHSAGQRSGFVSCIGR